MLSCVAYCVVAVESVGQQIPIAFLVRVKDDFSKRYAGGKAATAAPSSLNREFRSKLKEHMQYCVDHPEEINKLAKVQAQVSEVKNLMMENTEKVFDRGEKIELLVDKTENLRSQVLSASLTNAAKELEAEINEGGNAPNQDAAVPWIGLRKRFLAPVRKQGARRTCVFEASMVTTETHYKVNYNAKSPPEEFNYCLSLSDFKVYTSHTGKVLGANGSGGSLENCMEVLKEVGVRGVDMASEKKSEERFKIHAYRKFRRKDIHEVMLLLDQGKALAASFPISDNWKSMNGVGVYEFQEERALPHLHRKGKFRGHSVMIVGYFPDSLEEDLAALKSKDDIEEQAQLLLKLAEVVLAFQNSYGELWGELGGFGSIKAKSIGCYYLPIVCVGAA
ncbi:uncharacterized protein LOC119281156 [Triticum dicoccoides]|uniref:uncharacterized protein LOC119281156 n=1 Tax=Triticum dicoccoides TaxID=85692 RepID=UPI00188EC29C|nr:uncharacterized protein LOC119281156 [Triticum dicoccoides]